MSGTRTFRRSLRASAPCFVKLLSVRDEDGLKILECHVDGYPRPDIRWEKSGKAVGKSRKIHMVRSGDKCLLQIRMPQADDCGLYTCTATNIVGTASTHVKLGPAPQQSIKKLNGTTPQTLSPTRPMGLRSRSMDRSKESVDDNKSQCSRGTRSRSVSRSSRQDSSNQAKSKFSNFTNSLWKRNESQNSKKLEVIAPNKKEISKSMEDCRKPRTTILHKVKIPDIFVVQKHDSRSIDRTVKQSESVPSVIERTICDKSSVMKTNGSVVNGCLRNGTTQNSQVPNTGMNGQNRVRGRIAAYLKRFENPDPPVRLKERETERGGSLKQIKNEKNKERKSSIQVETEKFFKLGRFIRRKSSGGGKKSPELTVPDGSTFVSHIQQDIKNESDILKDNTTVEKNIIPDVSDSSNMLNVNVDISGSVEAPDLPSNHVKEVVVIPDITGFSLITESQIEEKISNKECAKDITVKAQEECIEKLDISKNDFVQTDNEEQISSSKVSRHEKTNSTKELVPLEDDRKIPTIYVQEIPEIEDTEISEEVDIEVESKESKLLTETEEIIENEVSSNRQCKGRISYSGPVLEEECEDLVNSNTQIESLESDLQRVSSPVETPARIVKGPQSVTVLRGESVTLAICFTGNPVPNVLWMKGGRVLRCGDDGRLSILEGREMSVVTVNEVTADDSGKYVVCVENEGGGDSRFASVAVVGFPEPPGGEPTASEVTDHSLVLSWYGSMYDGGSVVTGYQVEMCTIPDKKWYKVASSVNTSSIVQGLSMGQRYIFRVRAENKYGLSHPSKESKVICLNDYLQYDTSSDEEPEDMLENFVTIENGTLFTERFDLKEEVGKGKFGTVYRCVELSCGRPRAAKVIRCLKMKDKEKVRQEIEIMSRLHHPKLMQVLAAFESGRNMIMVMEFISGGELFERVIADDFVLTEHDCILFMKQILDGVAYMHKNDIIHLDLKPENILCKTRTSHKIKIIDFGLARVYKPDESLRILFGTPEFVAPEVINYEPVSPFSDMWSVGVVCYVLLSGLSPFMGDNDTETFSNITRGEMDFDDEAFDEISQDAKDFISCLLVKKIKGRMSAEECLKHPWLATARLVQKRPLSTEKLKRFIIRRKWQKSGTAIRALGRMVSLSRSSLGSTCDSPIGSPTSSRSRSSLASRSETAESSDSVFSR